MRTFLIEYKANCKPLFEIIQATNSVMAIRMIQFRYNKPIIVIKVTLSNINN